MSNQITNGLEEVMRQMERTWVRNFGNCEPNVTMSHFSSLAMRQLAMHALSVFPGEL